MHKRLRRQLDEALGQELEASPHLRKLFRKIEKEYRRADGDRASLQRRSRCSLICSSVGRKRNGVGDLAQDALCLATLRAGALRGIALRRRSEGDCLERAAERLFGIPEAEAVERELSMLCFPDTGANRAQARTELRQALPTETPHSCCARRRRSGERGCANGPSCRFAIGRVARWEPRR